MKAVAVIPCHNEQEHVYQIAKEARLYCEHVIVVNDHSTDRTRFEAAKAGAIVINNNYSARGAGIATALGIQYAEKFSPDVIVTLDGDGQHKASEIPLLFYQILRNEADLVIGSRFLNNYSIPKYRKLGINVINFLFNLGHKEYLTDTQSCFRAYSRLAYQHADITENRFGFSIETLVKAHNKGLRIKETPISCIYHKGIRSNSDMFPIKHGLMILASIAKWRIKLEAINYVKKAAYSILRVCAAPIRYFGLSGNNLFRKLYKLIMPLVVPDTSRIVELNGYKMQIRVDHKVNPIGVAQLLSISKGYDPVATEVCRQLVKPGMAVIDVGANIGYYSLLASKLVGNSKVWAFEPEQNNFNMLVSNLKLNGIQNVEPVKMAVGNTCGTAKLYISPTSDGMHSLLTDRKTKCKVQEVPVTTLDSYFKDKCEVNFLKTDTEGNDLAVLEGARNIIAASPDINVLFEFWLDGLEILNITASELLDRVHKLGLNYIYIINERRKCVEEATSDKIVIYSKQHGEGCNLLCSKQPYEYAKEN